MRRLGGALVSALLLAGCGQHAPSTVAYHLTTADILFVNDIRSNTRTFYGDDDREIALTGRGVCDVLGRGGTVDDAVRQLVPHKSVRGELDATYFATVAARRYCPEYPTRKPAPRV
jgi:hypothetical protein